MKNNLIILAALLVSTISVSAQKQTAFQEFIETTFEGKLSNINSYEDIAPFVKSFSDDMHWINVNVDINGKINESKLLTKPDLIKQISYLASRPSLSLKWEIEEYRELTKREDSRVASMKVKVSMYANDKLITSGFNLVQIVAVKKEGFYLINYMDLLRISSEAYVGPCYVMLNKTSDTKYLADIAYPNGNNYEHFETSIDIVSTSPFKLFLIDGAEKKYFWNEKTNDVSQSMKGQKVGNASTPENVMLIAISNESKERCSSIVRTAKIK